MSHNRWNALWFSRRDPMYESAQSEHTFYVVYQPPRSGGRQYASYVDAATFEIEAFSQAPEPKHFFELIRVDHPCLPYFDVEWYPLFKPEPTTAILDAVQGLVTKAFKHFFNKDLNATDFLFTCSSSPAKESYHLVIRRTEDPLLVFKNNHEAHLVFYRQMLELMSDEEKRFLADNGKGKPVIDGSVYDQHRSMRTCGSSKQEDPARVFRPYKSNRPWPEYLITEFCGRATVQLPELAVQQLQTHKYKSPTTAAQLLPEHPLRKKVLEAAQKAGEKVRLDKIKQKANGTMFCLIREGATTVCAVTGLTHESNNCFAMLSVEREGATECRLYCNSERCAEEYVSLFSHPPPLLSPAPPEIPTFGIEQQHLSAEKVDDWDIDQSKHAKDITDALNKPGSTVFLKSPMGKQKTTGLRHPLTSDRNWQDNIRSSAVATLREAIPPRACPNAAKDTGRGNARTFQ
jgi:hypothetical protein